MSIVCKQCGYENLDGSTICEICAEPLDVSIENTLSDSVKEIIAQENNEATVAQTEEVVDDGNEYFVVCPESQTKTILLHGNVTSFYCEGCKKTHEIDGFLWNIEKKEKSVTSPNVGNTTQPQNNAPKGNNLWLEEVNSHERIDIDITGGTLGRYGKYGANFFQTRGLLMVSGEHCLITNELGNWVLRHKSRTNQTKYNNMILDRDVPTLLEDGKVLTLANAVTFIVRIG